MAETRRLERVNLENIDISIDVVKKIPQKIAEDNRLIAFKEDNNILCIAIVNIPEILVIEELKFISGKEIKFFFTEENKIVNAINNYYSKHSVKSAIESIEIESSYYVKDSITTSEEALNEEKLQQSPAVKLTNSLINAAILQNASDIHIEPFENEVLVRFRIDGIINEFTYLPRKVYTLVNTRIKIMAYMDISEKRMPQDGKIKHTLEEKNYDLRVSTIPTIYGEKIVIRVLYRSDEMKSLHYIGFKVEDVEIIKSMIRSPHGIIIVTGPTGSGKTTTLYSMLNTLDKRHRNIISIEDPVEYTLYRINQVNVNTKIGFNFAEGLRSILRQDPDVIMVGEIRDEETAQISIRAAITGHLVISTLHTNDAAESILRLEDMGVPRYYVEEAIIGIIAQRLIRNICPYCKTVYNISAYEKNNLNLSFDDKLYRGKGCWRCNNTGYKGRTVIYEIMDMRKLKNNIRNKNSTDEIRKYAMSKGMISMRNNCIELVKKGVTTFEEFIRINI